MQTQIKVSAARRDKWATVREWRGAEVGGDQIVSAATISGVDGVS